jgi:hypothetical protein
VIGALLAVLFGYVAANEVLKRVLVKSWDLRH